MNFFFPDQPIEEWMERPVFLLVPVLLASIPSVMLTWMRQHGWIKA